MNDFPVAVFQQDNRFHWEMFALAPSGREPMLYATCCLESHRRGGQCEGQLDAIAARNAAHTWRHQQANKAAN